MPPLLPRPFRQLVRSHNLLRGMPLASPLLILEEGRRLFELAHSFVREEIANGLH